MENVDALLGQASQAVEPMAARSEGTPDTETSTEETTDSSAEDAGGKEESTSKEESATSSKAEEQGTDSTGRSIKYKGKEIGLDDSKYQMYAQKGYDYEQKMHQYRVDRKLFEQEKESYGNDIDELKSINDFAKANPEFQSMLQREWAKIQNGGVDPNQSAYARQNDPSALEAKLNSVMQRLDATEQQRVARDTAEKEAKLESAVESYKEKFDSFEWDKRDEFDQTLEDRVTQHAIDNGIKSWTAAANDYLMEEHLNRASLSAKEKAGSDIQKQNKLGLGKITKKPQLNAIKSGSIKNKSYSDLANEALAELGYD
jgi:hypothetical protein